MSEYGDCTFCGGQVVERRAPKACWWGDQLVAVINNVPTGVCQQCGERYFKAKVLKRIEAQLKQLDTFPHVSLPAAEFASGE
ncbi:MAG: YgiT-type zinc finger protein [Deinococcus sp.]|nr:YgiT-type zinc finger protein [Deinococcus sp.]